jgi:PASTA domain
LRIIAAGMTNQADDFTVVRLKADGWTDPEFRAGKCNGSDFASSSRDWPYAAVLQGDRRIVVVGSTRPPGSDDSAFAVARYQNPAPPICVVPNLRGKTLRATRAPLARANCRLGKVTRAYSRIVAKRQVISQRPRPGARLAERANVNVLISRGRRR